MLKNKFLTLALVSVVGTNVYSTELSQPLQEKIRNSQIGETFDLHLLFAERVDSEFFKTKFERENATKLERRKILVAEMKRVTKNSQVNAIKFLESQKNHFKSYESFWGPNTIKIFGANFELINQLAEFSEIATITLVPIYKIPTPVSSTSKKNQNQTSQTAAAIKATNAHKLWDLGFNGSGRVSMTIDSGVDGNHPYLANYWYGNQLDPNHWFNAWFDAVGSTTFPEDKNILTHGTGVTSMIVGHTLVDTIGIAPGANWIGSKHTPDGQQGIFSAETAMQWMITLPDSVFDLIDVANNSYGGNVGGCATINDFNLRTNVELTGVTMIYAAGNDGPNPQTVGEVGGGAISSVNTFTVGALQVTQNTIAGFSSRGPSGCTISPIVPPPHNALYGIKPEVCAQGENIKVAKGAYQGGGTEFVDGTSFSAPLVSGAILLLKQINPLATPDEVKLALLNTAVDFGSPGDDNSFGMGRIDVLAAAGEVAPFAVNGSLTDSNTQNPIAFGQLKVVETEQTFITPIDGSFTVKPLVDTITLEVSAFGYQTQTYTNIPQLTSGNPINQDFTLVSNPTAIISGSVSDLNSSNSVQAEIEIYANSPDDDYLLSSVSTDVNGNYSFTLPEESYYLKFIPNFPFPEKNSQIFNVVGGQNQSINYAENPAEILLMDDDESTAIDTIYQQLANANGDSYFYWETGGTLPSMNEYQQLGGSRIIVWYSDNVTGDVLTNAEEQFLVDVLNQGGRVLISGQNIASSESGGTLMNLIGVNYDSDFTGTSGFLKGFANSPLDNLVMNSVGANDQNLQSSKEIIGTFGNATAIAGYGFNGIDGDAIAAFHNPQSSVGRAIFMGFDLASLKQTAASVTPPETIFDNLINFLSLTVDVDENSNLAKTYVLEQNYPNPFNPSTVINYQIPQNQKGKITIFNILGKNVKEFELKKSVGSVNWNGTNELGNLVSSGVYFYKLESGTFSKTIKMTFLK
ncbi:MAG: T9SS C-terminal target domain-containing protein [Calditrichaeota bacterium]|nr:MAG: T9SS C-terminal target domain-containing protein [Calditrichota bacterium]